MDKVSLGNCIKEDILDVIQKYRSRKAAVWYEAENIIREVTYGDIDDISMRIQRCLKEFVQDCCVGLLMDHNLFIPSIILCLHNLNCCFTFLENNSNINEMGEISKDLKIIISQDKKINPPNYTFKEAIILPWDHKLYVYRSEMRKNYDGYLNINYIIQTSGTTGVGKIVKVEHYCIYSNICCLRSKLDITPDDVIYFGTALSFDPSMIELYLALTSGACLLIISKEIRGNLSFLHKTLFNNANKAYNISFLQMCPSVFLRWNVREIDFILNHSDLRFLLLGGESFPKAIENMNTTKARIFNIYGITEVSCWASMEEIRSGTKISLGETLDDTIFEVRDEEGTQIFNGEGELYIGSKKRICLVNNEKFNKDTTMPLFRQTGDLVAIQSGKKIFYKGRTNEIFKRFGIRVDSKYVEDRIFEITQLESKLIFLESHRKLILFIKLDETNRSVILRVCDKVKIKLLHSLNKEQFPDHIEAVSNFPVTNNGKVDKNKLKLTAVEIFENQYVIDRQKSRDKNKFIDEIEIFNNLWVKYLPSSSNYPDKTFYDLGGSSILRIQFSNEFKELVGNNELPTHFFDYLFTNPYSDIIGFIKNYKFKRKCTETNPSDNKKLKSSNNGAQISIEWSYDLKACVDTTPFVIEKKKYIAIGAFSNILAILNVMNGTEISKIILPSAIESSCLSTSSGKQTFIGCSDCYLYCIKTDTGNILWSYKTGDKIKNKPVFVMEENAIVFGSYDKYLYCLEAKTGLLLWKIFLNSGITADPVRLKGVDAVFVATIQGVCCLINNNGEILWNTKLESPIFSSPCILGDDNNIIVAEVRGILHCLNSKNGNTIWNYKVDNHIYSSLKTYKNQVFFTSHDSFIYCLEIANDNADLKFKVQLDSASSSSVEVVKIGENLEYLITASINGTVYLIDLSKEIVLEKIKFNAEIFSSPAVFITDNAEVLTYIGCRDNNLHCIKFLVGSVQ